MAKKTKVVKEKSIEDRIWDSANKLRGNLTERYAILLEQEDGLRLRKANRIKTIHSSLAIEGNTLSEDEVRDIIDGKSVVAACGSR